MFLGDVCGEAISRRLLLLNLHRALPGEMWTRCTPHSMSGALFASSAKHAEMLGDKAIVFVAQEHAQDGFASVAFDTLKVEFYTATQYEDCMELRRKANRFVQALRFRKAFDSKLRSVSDGMTPMSSPS
jgi:hypothetical protein